MLRYQRVLLLLLLVHPADKGCGRVIGWVTAVLIVRLSLPGRRSVLRGLHDGLDVELVLRRRRLLYDGLGRRGRTMLVVVAIHHNDPLV